jgi:hypothetical protein
VQTAKTLVELHKEREKDARATVTVLTKQLQHLHEVKEALIVEAGCCCTLFLFRFQFSFSIFVFNFVFNFSKEKQLESLKVTCEREMNELIRYTQATLLKERVRNVQLPVHTRF